MVEIFSLADVLALFLPGVMAGLGLSTIFWLIGYAVASIYRMISK